MIDGRIPVVFGAAAGPDDVTLAASGAAHPAACACCIDRGLAAAALDRLFLQRVRGEIPWFRRVVVAAADDAELRKSLENDPVLSARFRLG